MKRLFVKRVLREASFLVKLALRDAHFCVKRVSILDEPCLG